MIFGMDIDFKTEQADSIIQHCETALGMDDMETWLHCLSVAVGLCPSKDMTINISLSETEMEVRA